MPATRVYFRNGPTGQKSVRARFGVRRGRRFLSPAPSQKKAATASHSTQTVGVHGLVAGRISGLRSALTTGERAVTIPPLCAGSRYGLGVRGPLMRRRWWTPARTLVLATCLVPGCLFASPDRAIQSEPTRLPAQTTALRREAGASTARPSDYGAHEPTPLPDPPPSATVKTARPPQPGPAEEERPSAILSPPPAVSIPVVPPTPPPPPDVPLVAALRCLLQKHSSSEAADLLHEYSKADQETLLVLLQIAAPLGTAGLEQLSAEQLTSLLEQVQALEQSLRARAGLILDHMTLCRKIVGFGVYEPLPADYVFQAGCNNHPGERIRVYAEVRNFLTRPASGRETGYETSLDSTVEILDFRGQRIWAQNFPACIDRSQTRRRDFFINFELHVPAEVPPGQYTLVMRVRDNHAPVRPGGPRVAQCSVDFRVGGSGGRTVGMSAEERQP